jgi:hypothetical protein
VFGVLRAGVPEHFHAIWILRLGDLRRGSERALSWYPAEHRATYGAEMVDVLMDCVAPDQRRPSLRQRADLARGAVRCWATWLRRRRESSAWPAAAGVVALVVIAGYAVEGLVSLAQYLVDVLKYPDSHPQLGQYEYLPPLLWGVALVALLVGGARSRIVLGWLACCAQAGVDLNADLSLSHSLRGGTVGYLLLCGLALCVTASAEVRPLWRPLGRVRSGVLLGALGVFLLSNVAERVPASARPAMILTGRWYWILPFAVQPLVLFVLLIGAPTPAQRRLRLIASGWMLFLAGWAVFTGFGGRDINRLPATGYVACALAVSALPVLWLYAGTVLVRRWERRSRGGRQREQAA